MKEDFDFLFGAWNVHNRFLRQRLRGSSEWTEFEAEYDARPVLGGLGNIDEIRVANNGASFAGTTLRLYDPETGDWTLHWADTKRAGKLLPPMIGFFRGDVGEFYGEEEVEGRKVLCRFRWLRVPPDAPRWEQAFSDDDGKTWETNWIMTFTRKELSP